MRVYKIHDVIQCEFLKIPKTMFANESYRKLSSDAKLTYALLYDRLSLSKLNGWINENDEVYLIYTREEIAEDLGISYKKAISAFRELLMAGLIHEHRCGRGMPNMIYIVKPELADEAAREFTKQENSRTAESAYQAELMPNAKMCENGISENEHTNTDVTNEHIKNFQNGISRTDEPEYQDVPKSHTIKTNKIKTDINHTENSQSVLNSSNIKFYTHEKDRPTDIYSFDDILELCQLDTFAEEERIILYDALERMYYSELLKIGDAILPQDKVRSRMYELNATLLHGVIDKLHQNDKQIKNITAYVMSTIFNAITEEYSLLHVDAYLNSMRRKE
ncbi:MAG: replication initiator protein A [Eubacteriales bacterium]|nr:replication initiator protein A [Eubacteriales bacterium]